MYLHMQVVSLKVRAWDENSCAATFHEQVDILLSKTMC